MLMRRTVCLNLIESSCERVQYMCIVNKKTVTFFVFFYGSICLTMMNVANSVDFLGSA